MEILSVGEKIKRARIYKRLTLKDICDDKISVSKMSCIENGKINPDDEILEFIAKKLNIDFGYLKYGVKDQFQNNLDKLDEVEENKKDEYLRYNVYYAEQYEYYDVAFQFMHLLFNLYLDTNNLTAIQGVTSEYYDISRKIKNRNNKFKYYLDIGKYLFMSGEYEQAINYYSRIRNELKDNNNSDKELTNIMIGSYYYEAKCYALCNKHDKAYQLGEKLTEFIHLINDDEKIGYIYNLMMFLSIEDNTDKFNFFKDKAYKYININDELKSKYEYNCGLKMVENDKIEDARECISKAFKLFPVGLNYKYTPYMINFVNCILRSDDLHKFKDICDDILDYSIEMDNNMLIEKCYYLKSKIFNVLKDFDSYEMYMNLALDLLIKIGDKEALYDRYMEMGNMYFKFDNVKESLKYFNLAIKLDEKI
ncbi:MULTISPECIES: helix-turn-helix domain-containing protein [Clostridium]|uniref:helix-turn-helix domain-containing protein n=1 Tax=Clostridium TaxID=1485 RepID=UPI000825E397|nr:MULTISPECIES: helix-turn-helix transcriptional regulator [Clostridium]PJI07359.1 XRE family transcriptional regulator [Clostridium sp. CT7]